MKAKNKTKKRLSIKLQIFIAMLALCTILIVSIWVFQVGFLRLTFRAVKNTTTDRLSLEISDCIDNGTLDESKYASLVEEYKSDISIAIFLIEENRLSELHSSNHSIVIGSDENQELLSKWLNNASKNAELLYKTENSGELIFVRLAGVDSEGAPTHMMVLNTDLEPPYLTKIAMYSLMVVITIVALAIYIGVAFAVSRSISAPIESMSKKAKSLSLYDYDVTFDEKGPQEIRELAEALNSSTQELKKLSATQKELIANISHDLRTPLTMISGYSEVMRDFPDEVTPENMQIIIDETARLNSLVNDLLTVSKLQSGTQSIDVKEISITRVINDTVKRYEKLLEHKDYTIKFESDGEVFVLADETRLLQVVYNLINNAINYTGDDKTVTVKQEINDGVVRISVIDTGEGISEENLPLIWDRYYKVDKVHKRAILGTGLGLSIVKNILLLHGSRFGVSSEVGKGSIFWFEFKIERMEK
jgi:signal transduction histidine kinase